MQASDNNLRELVAGVAASYFENSHVSPQEIPSAIAQIAGSLAAIGNAEPAAPPPPEGPAKPSTSQVRKSVTPDALISFEDGKSYKTLKRHLTLRGLTPADYKAKWGLPHDYPMTAPSYSARRSELAKSSGLGIAPKARRKARKPKT
jgi:predicted transcriptional regulator